MARKRYKAEEIVAKLRQVDVLTSQGQSMADAIRQIGVSEVTYYRWRQEFGGLKIEQLCVIAYDGQPAPFRFESQEDRSLQAVRILIFVDQHMIETVRHILCNGAFDHHLRPVEQQIVVIEHVLLLLRFHIGAEQRSQFRFPFCAPGKEAIEHLAKRCLGVDDARVD